MADFVLDYGWWVYDGLWLCYFSFQIIPNSDFGMTITIGQVCFDMGITP